MSNVEFYIVKELEEGSLLTAARLADFKEFNGQKVISFQPKFYRVCTEEDMDIADLFVMYIEHKNSQGKYTFGVCLNERDYDGDFSTVSFAFDVEHEGLDRLFNRQEDSVLI